VVLSGIYREFAVTGLGLEEIVKIARQAREGRAEVPRFGYRVTRLSGQVYALNVQMLGLLSDESVGRSAPRVPPPGGSRPSGKPGLEIGDQGAQVRHLQRALRRAGADVDIDGLFRSKTWEALCSLQRSLGVDADGIAGPATWAELPSGARMPVLRSGSRGEAVSQLQLTLASLAPGRWESSPQAPTGVFDASTSAAVKAFQKWNSIHADGIVGDQTWAAPAGESSLESAVGLKFLTTEKAAAEENRSNS
jgi:peptidoglycan hydrolase-like protein with peptidoglycan-binding domain